MSLIRQSVQFLCPIAGFTATCAWARRQAQWAVTCDCKETGLGPKHGFATFDWEGEPSREIPFGRDLLLFLLFPLPVWGGPQRHSAKPAPLSDPGYVLALGTANRFLHAWQSGDLETGMVLLSDNVRRSHDAKTLEDLFSERFGPGV